MSEVPLYSARDRNSLSHPWHPVFLLVVTQEGWRGLEEGGW